MAERKYPCSECGREFTTDQIEVHLALHADQHRIWRALRGEAGGPIRSSQRCDKPDCSLCDVTSTGVAPGVTVPAFAVVVCLIGLGFILLAAHGCAS